MARLTPGPGKKINKKKPVKSPGSAVISGFKKIGEAVKNATSSKKLRKGTSGEAAGVVSRTRGVTNLSEARVKGSRQAGIEGLKKKRKSGEMSRQEANAKIKTLRQGAKVTGEAPSARFFSGGPSIATGKETSPNERKQREARFKKEFSKTPAAKDSLTWLKTMRNIDPFIAEESRSDLAKLTTQAKKLFPNATTTYGRIGGNPTARVKFNTPVNKMNPAQKAYYEKWKEKNK